MWSFVFGLVFGVFVGNGALSQYSQVLLQVVFDDGFPACVFSGSWTWTGVAQEHMVKFATAAGFDVWGSRVCEIMCSRDSSDAHNIIEAVCFGKDGVDKRLCIQRFEEFRGSLGHSHSGVVHESDGPIVGTSDADGATLHERDSQELRQQNMLNVRKDELLLLASGSSADRLDQVVEGVVSATVSVEARREILSENDHASRTRQVRLQDRQPYYVHLREALQLQDALTAERVEKSHNVPPYAARQAELGNGNRGVVEDLNCSPRLIENGLANMEHAKDSTPNLTSCAQLCQVKHDVDPMPMNAHLQCDIEREQLSDDLKKLRSEFAGSRAAWDLERETLRLEVRKVNHSQMSYLATTSELDRRVHDAAVWPDCVEKNVVFRGRGMFSAFEDLEALFGRGVTSGCWMSDCVKTDKFETSRVDDCAHACAALPGCSFWSHGDQDGISQCFLRASNRGRESADGFVAGSRSCAPTATEVSSAQSALAVFESLALLACDAGVVNSDCPDLKDAMRTWIFGIKSLKHALTMHPGLDPYIDHILSDAEAFVATDPETEGLSEMYHIVSSNNRQVFQASRDVLIAESADTTVSRLDASIPKPVRGLLCGDACEHMA